MKEKVAGDNVYPGCLVGTKKRVENQYPLRVPAVERSPRHPNDRRRREITLGWSDVGIVISVFPNDVVQSGSRTWLVYFYPFAVAIDQRDIQRVSLSWKEAQSL